MMHNSFSGMAATAFFWAECGIYKSWLAGYGIARGAGLGFGEYCGEIRDVSGYLIVR